MFQGRTTKRFALLALLMAVPVLLYFIIMPDVSKLKTEHPRETSFMEYQEREIRKKGRPFKIHQIWVPWSRISSTLGKAVLIAEDDKSRPHQQG